MFRPAGSVGAAAGSLMWREAAPNRRVIRGRQWAPHWGLNHWVLNHWVLGIGEWRGDQARKDSPTSTTVMMMVVQFGRTRTESLRILSSEVRCTCSISISRAAEKESRLVRTA